MEDSGMDFRKYFLIAYRNTPDQKVTGCKIVYGFKKNLERPMLYTQPAMCVSMHVANKKLILTLNPNAMVSRNTQWSFRKIGTMGTLGPKDRSSRPEGPANTGVGVLGEGAASPLPTSQGV